MGKLRASYLLASESFEFLRKDKEMLWFPLISLFSNILVIVCVGLLYVVYFLSTEDTSLNDTSADTVVAYLFLFLAYLGLAFVFTFFQGAIATMVRMRIEGKDPTIADGIGRSMSHLRKILYWSVVTSTVGIIINVMQERLGWLGKIFGLIGTVAWSVLTFFMVPVLILEDLSVKDSLARSGKVFKDTWGETLVMNFSLGLFFGALHIMWMIICAVLVFVFIDALLMLLVLLILFVLGFTALCVVSSLLSAIFKVVLYEYSVSGKVPDSFTPELIIGAIKRTTVPKAPAPLV
jgi:hypothetical protein